MRGEYISTMASSLSASGSPPHARGIHSIQLFEQPEEGITPACAGNTEKSWMNYTILWDHPRMRGEYFHVLDKLCHFLGSPPHARGILKVAALQELHPGITPACAGNTSSLIIGHCLARDHPRMRGEYCFKSISASLRLGSPPHARGIPPTHEFLSALPGITPACAGNTYIRLYSPHL